MVSRDKDKERRANKRADSEYREVEKSMGKSIVSSKKDKERKANK